MPGSSGVFMGLPGGNPGGGSNAVPTVGATPAPAIGGQTNPLTPAYPGGTNGVPLTFPAYGSPQQSQLTALEGMSPAPSGLAGDQNWMNAVKKAFHSAGFPSAIGDLLSQFLANGAGFNPQAIQSMLAALQPSIAQGQSNIMEQFGAEGLSSSSPAAIGLAGFNAQATLNEGQIISQMYEQSVQDYMTVLMGARKPSNQQGGVGGLLGGLASISQGLPNIGTFIKGMYPSGDSSGGGGGGVTGGEVGAVAGLG
jgi:hypothetical protein